MKFMNSKTMVRNILITICLPILMFVVMYTITKSNGIDYYGQAAMWKAIFRNLGMAVTMGCGLAMQLRHGRFDFSGGATMVLAGILGVYYTQQFNGGPMMLLTLCVVFSVMISMITATVYVTSKLPIIICTIMLALVYEALTLVLAGGNGVNIMANVGLNIFGREPYTIYIMVFAMILYQIILSLTPFGYRAKLLRHGQHVSVNIGINERKNVITAYVFSGILFGLAATIFVSQNKVETLSNLSSTGILFSYIASVYIGMFLGKLTLEIVGLTIGALTIQLMNYGLGAMGYDSGGWNNIFFGIFMMTFWIITSKAGQIEIFLSNLSKKKEIGQKT
ncbi:abc transporter permease [Trichococcus collinsii]|uniref:Branched-chain amino acid transport system / permease component n=2 Tax=Trichococcus collinsii TaxID=157076 RepID=A0AB38A2X4_9LACT|nr:abc transporter permease [Trichococcus collinsii]SEA83618.1 Branched-chain amino acid transport system / permease component [Trichococcus collinsii]